MVHLNFVLERTTYPLMPKRYARSKMKLEGLQPLQLLSVDFRLSSVLSLRDA
jgi:hypothetical protein